MSWRLAALAAGVASGTALPCTFSLPGPDAQHCWVYDLGALPARDFTLHSSYPDTYYVNSPCSAGVTQDTLAADCPASASALAAGAAEAVQQRPAGACLSLGSGNGTAQVTAVGGQPQQGLELAFSGGDGGRRVIFHMVCNASVAEPSAPDALIVEGPSEQYNVNWHTALACPVLSPSTAAHCRAEPTPPPTPLPLPTEPQLAYHADEMGAIGHFNMGTFQSCGIGVDGVNVPPPSTFNPAAGKIDTDLWVASLKAYGARRAVLVVSHGCGFSTFPARTAFPAFNFTYSYSIASVPAYQKGKGDLARDFVASCAKYSVKPGFYYGAMNNAFLNVVGGKVQAGAACAFCPDITQDQYTQILLAQLRQLWTDYGSIAEVWFDGGYPPGTKELVTALQLELQPDSVGFQGPSVNSVRWAGTESGHAAPDMWMTAASSSAAGAGDPNARSWFPPEADTCFQAGCRKDVGEQQHAPALLAAPAGGSVAAPYGGCWFYNPSLCAPPLSDLISKYHNTVGLSSLLLLDWAPSPNGTLREDHVAMYKTFGNWIRACYGGPAPLSAPFNGTVGVIASSSGAVIDRILLGEDLALGQRVRAFTVEIDGVQVFAAKSIGNKRIVVLAKNYTVASNVTVHVTEAAASPVLRIFEARQCASTPPPATSCNAVQGTVFMGPLVRKQPVASADACCDACRAEPSCAVYNFHAAGSCELLSAQSGTTAEAGATSGTPSH